jgi:CheY-like chemotaxis protein
VPTWIVGDVARLRQILVNLLNNAIKFTPHGYVSVEVRAVETPSGAPAGDSRAGSGRPAEGAAAPAETRLIEIGVRDSGIGIPSKKMNLLFKPFSQVDASSTRRYGGTGLGLVICQRLCHLMGGEIRVESEPDRGSLFVITIPVEPLPAPPPSPRTVLPAELQGRTVCVVDSHAANRRFLAATLAGAGLTCHLAESAAAVRALAAAGPPPELLIVDHALPDGTAGQLILDLRQRWQRPRLPVLFMLPAGESTPPALLEELAPAFPLFKPLKLASLTATIRSALVTTSKPA